MDIGDPVQATGEGLTYALGGNDAVSFAVVADTGQLWVKAALDYETKTSYELTVVATDPAEVSSSIEVTISVTNVEEPGTIAFASDRFEVGTAIDATLADPDGGINEAVWTWERSLDQTAWTAISGASFASYTPATEDVEQYLRVTARYADGEGPNKEASRVSDAMVWALPNPTGLSAGPGDNTGEVALSWLSSTGATAHWVWSVRPDGSGGKWTGGQPGSAVVGDLEAGQTYWFVVIEEVGQLDGMSQWSAYSNWDRAMASEQLNPTGLSAVPGDSAGEVALTWTPVADATARWVWSVKADGTDGKWTAGQAGSAVVGDLEVGITYWFVVIEELGHRDGASQWSAYSNWDRAAPR